MHTILMFDGLSWLMAALILIVALTVASFSRRYMDGDRRQTEFFRDLATLTGAVLLLVFANHIILFAVAWAATGWCLAGLIGHVRSWTAARNAARIARFHFIGGSAALMAALAVLTVMTGQWTVTGIRDEVSALPASVLWLTGGLIGLAALVQSALFPFHKWLLSSMTTPTPVSAFMHAGLVNAGGFLIVRFAPLFSALPDLLLVLFAAGALSAFLAGYWMLTQSDIKRSLGCSTVAQMGFMVMQCGIGFYTAAIAHLILHGFFKAYHFLAAGSAVGIPERPEKKSDSFTLTTAGLMLAGGVIAGVLFAILTGKSLMALDSGSLLIAFASLAGMQAAYGLAGLSHLPVYSRTVLTVLVTATATALYAGLFVGIESLLTVNAAQPLTIVHAAVMAVFAGAWLMMRAGVHKNSPALYLRSLNGAQPPRKTILNHRSMYNAG